MTAWGHLGRIAGEALGCRSLLQAALFAAIGGVAVAALGVWLVRGATGGLGVGAYSYTAILTVAALVYAGAGAIAGVQSALLNAAARAARAVGDSVRPVVERIVSDCLERGEYPLVGLDPAEVDALIDKTFAQMAGSTELPVLRHLTRAAAAVGKWKCKRDLEPLLAPLRIAGAGAAGGRVSGEALKQHLALVAVDAVVSVATDQAARARVMAWLIPAGLLLVPAAAWVWRVAKG